MTSNFDENLLYYTYHDTGERILCRLIEDQGAQFCIECVNGEQKGVKKYVSPTEVEFVTPEQADLTEMSEDELTHLRDRLLNERVQVSARSANSPTKRKTKLKEIKTITAEAFIELQSSDLTEFTRIGHLIEEGKMEIKG